MVKILRYVSKAYSALLRSRRNFSIFSYDTSSFLRFCAKQQIEITFRSSSCKPYEAQTLRVCIFSVRRRKATLRVIGRHAVSRFSVRTVGMSACCCWQASSSEESRTQYTGSTSACNRPASVFCSASSHTLQWSNRHPPSVALSASFSVITWVYILSTN